MKIFTHCPGCTSDDLEYDQVKRYFCRTCGYTYFQNPAPAVSGIIFYTDKVLLIKRAKDPGKGKIDLPGGFIDPGESSEDALKREILEELGVQVCTFSYFASFPNKYEYKGIVYSTCDFIYTLTIDRFPDNWNRDEVRDILLVSPGRIHTLEFAFASIKNGINAYFVSIDQKTDQ